MIDIDGLAKPVSDTDPVGENTEYTDLAALERLAAGTPGTLDPKTQAVIGGEEPDWNKVRQLAVELFSRTKDLRIACILTRSELALAGYSGLGQGLLLTARLVRDFWDGVYPQLDKDDGDDPIERLNALAYFNAPTGFLSNLRRMPIVESRAVGRFNLRDLDMSSGRLPAPEGVSPPTAELLAAAWQSGDPAANSAKRTGVADALQAIGEVEAAFREHSGERPDLDGLKQNLRRVKEFYDLQAKASDPSVEGEGGLRAVEQEEILTSQGAASVSAGGVTMARASGLTSRADAIRMLKEVSVFLRRSEPSSPAPMFVDRAVKVLQMDFAAIVRELMPDARDRIELLGGVSLNEPSE